MSSYLNYSMMCLFVDTNKDNHIKDNHIKGDTKTTHNKQHIKSNTQLGSQWIHWLYLMPLEGL